jgi:hypothetical protein
MYDFQSTCVAKVCYYATLALCIICMGVFILGLRRVVWLNKKKKFVRFGMRPLLYSNMFKRGPQINEESMWWFEAYILTYYFIKLFLLWRYLCQIWHLAMNPIKVLQHINFDNQSIIWKLGAKMIKLVLCVHANHLHLHAQIFYFYIAHHTHTHTYSY